MYGCSVPELHDIYHSLPLLAHHRYEIESAIYRNSKKICERINTVLYYDCTNFYFETEDDDDFRKYGKSKENRPNPIVQYGMFMDASGIPIADICFAGNKTNPSPCPLWSRFWKRTLDTAVSSSVQMLL